MCPGKTLSSALLFCLTCPRAMAAVRDELSAINGEVFSPLNTLLKTQFVNSQVQLSDRSRLPYIQAVFYLWFSIFCKIRIDCDLLNVPKGTSGDCTFSLCPPYSPTSQDNWTNPGPTFTLLTVWESLFSGWKTCTAHGQSRSGDNLKWIWVKLLASQDALEVMFVTYLLTDWLTH